MFFLSLSNLKRLSSFALAHPHPSHDIPLVWHAFTGVDHWILTFGVGLVFATFLGRKKMLALLGLVAILGVTFHEHQNELHDYLQYGFLGLSTLGLFALGTVVGQIIAIQLKWAKVLATAVALAGLLVWVL